MVGGMKQFYDNCWVNISRTTSWHFLSATKLWAIDKYRQWSGSRHPAHGDEELPAVERLSAPGSWGWRSTGSGAALGTRLMRMKKYRQWSGSRHPARGDEEVPAVERLSAPGSWGWRSTGSYVSLNCMSKNWILQMSRSRQILGVEYLNLVNVCCSVNCLAGVFLIQAWIMWNFITFHLHRARERATAEAPVINKKLNSPASPQRKKKRGVWLWLSTFSSWKTLYCRKSSSLLSV